ncbi:MAG: replicative DNA helicase [Candidatus Dojkabacteria bacterium]|nr:replicative DNA helicase [Candidatus Dojkabacteria bacterium]
MIVRAPHDYDAERHVLASILLDKEALVIALDRLGMDDFYDDRHILIFSECVDLFSKSKVVDIVTLKSSLKSKNLLDKAGGVKYINSLVSVLPITTNIEYYCNIIKEHSLRRKIISLSTKISHLGFDLGVNIDEIINTVEQEIFSVSQSKSKKLFFHIKDIIAEINEKIENPDKYRDDLRGISTGFNSIDKYIGGLHRGDLIIIAARPSVGKTAFMLEITRNVAVNIRKKVLIFSLEMGKEQVGDRLLALQAEVSLADIRMGNISEHNWEACHDAMSVLYESEIYIDDTPGLHIFDLRTRCRKWQLEFGIDAIFIDYLQLLRGKSRENRALEVSEISQGLKNIARELNVPVVALSQLNRSVENRNDRRPQLSDLRESGSIEQDSDIVIFLHREAYYNKDVLDEERDVAEAIIAKNRNGPTGISKLRFIDELAKFVDFESTE